MIARALFGLAALLPVALNAGPATAGSITMILCTGDGLSRILTIPMSQGKPAPADENSPCHAKGCHAGGSRKRLDRHI